MEFVKKCFEVQHGWNNGRDKRGRSVLELCMNRTNGRKEREDG